MRYTSTYSLFNESKSISDSCEKILYKIKDEIISEISKLKNGYIIQNIDLGDLKVNNLKISWNIEIGHNNICDGISDVKDFDNSNITLNISYFDMSDEFKFYIESVLLHELLHLYQYYNLKIKNKFRPESWSIGSIIPQLRKVVKSEYVIYLLDNLYFSLSHELSAQLHQYFLYKKNDKIYPRIFDIRKSLSNFYIKDDLSDIEIREIDLIKKHIINSILYLTKNKNYIKHVKKSIWYKDIQPFLSELKIIFNEKVKWLDEKVKKIDSRVDGGITYETVSLPTNWGFDNYEMEEDYRFIKEFINNCPKYNFI